MSSSSARFHDLIQREIEVTTVFGTKYKGRLASVNSFINPEYIPGEPESAESITLSPPGEIIGVLYVTGTNGESLTMLDTHTSDPFF